MNIDGLMEVNRQLNLELLQANEVNRALGLRNKELRDLVTELRVTRIKEVFSRQREFVAEAVNCAPSESEIDDVQPDVVDPAFLVYLEHRS